jgi:hypothetical protein
MRSLIGAIVAEFVGAPRGAGALIMSMTYPMDVASQFSVLIASHSPSSGKGVKAKIFYTAYQASITALRYLKAAQLRRSAT